MARTALTRDPRAWFILPPVAVMVLLIAVPIAEIFWTIAQHSHDLIPLVGHILGSPLYEHAILNTLQIATLVSLGTLFVGYPISYLILHSSDTRQKALLGLTIASMWLSVLVRSYAWTVLLAQEGPINFVLRYAGVGRQLLFTRTSVVLAMIHVLTPYVVLSIWSVNDSVVRKQLPVASSFGASRALYLLHVFLPQSLPSAMAGATFVFLLSLGFLITPELLGGGQAGTMMIAALIDEQITQLGNWAQGSILALILLLTVTILLVGFWRLWSAWWPPLKPKNTGE